MYIAAQDNRSPFYGREEQSEYCVHRLYNYYLHPQWDEFGSSTLYGKLLFADYDERFAVLELIGEWNDALHNDIMFLKREVIDPLMEEGITKFVLLADNVLNFYSGDDDYYQEWWEDLNEAGGWVAMLHARQHVQEELFDARLDHFMHTGEDFNLINWRPQKPRTLFQMVDLLVTGQTHRISE